MSPYGSFYDKSLAKGVNLKSSESSPTTNGPITYYKRVVPKQQKKRAEPKYPFMHESVTITEDHVNTVDHESITSAGYKRCLDAYNEWRENKKPVVAPNFTRFDEQYELTPKVLRGRSEFFEIKQCRDRATEDFKGVKIYRKAELSADCITMIKKEIDLTKTIDHPNLCRVYDVIEDEKKIYIIIDDLRGRSLFDHIIQKNTLGENETAIIA